jgi:hypothetical protein
MGVPVVNTQHSCHGGAGATPSDPPGFTLPDELHGIDLGAPKAPK